MALALKGSTIYNIGNYPHVSRQRIEMSDYSRYQCLKIEKGNRLATVTLNQPETGNRIEHRFHMELQDIWADLARDGEVNAILLTGSGKYFSVGGNIKGMQDRPGGDVFEAGAMLEPSGGRRIVQNILDC